MINMQDNVQRRDMLPSKKEIQANRRAHARPHARTHTHTHRQKRGSFNKDVHTFLPSSQLIQRSPLVRKQATACRARWWIQPSRRSWVMMASMKGKPVRAFIGRQRQRQRKRGKRQKMGGYRDPRCLLLDSIWNFIT